MGLIKDLLLFGAGVGTGTVIQKRQQISESVKNTQAIQNIAKNLNDITEKIIKKE